MEQKNILFHSIFLMQIKDFVNKIEEIIKEQNWNVPVEVNNKLKFVRIGIISDFNSCDDYSFEEIIETESNIKLIENAIFNLERLYKRLETIKKSEEQRQDILNKLNIKGRF